MRIKQIASVALVATLSIFLFPSLTAAKTATELQTIYDTQKKTGEKIKILVVPGHDDEYNGTQFRDTRESDMTVAVGQYLYNYLSQDPHFDVALTRTQQGYTPTFKKYFEDNKDAITAFIKEKSSSMKTQVQSGTIKTVVSVPHNTAAPEVALRLFGINKWANENDVDLVIHIHFNDTPSRPADNPGKYRGITVYIPEHQYSNGATSRVLGNAVFAQLSKFFISSTMPQESAGVVEDQDLIAIGSSNSLDGASALIEYGYVYEPQYQNLDIRELLFKDLAFQTYLGIHQMFGDSSKYAGKYSTPLLPHIWKTEVKANTLFHEDILALQAALRSQGLYAEKEGVSTCRMAGTFDPCTVKALKQFQKKYGISQTGTLGPITRGKLNLLFGK